jgi:hypothetical protein
MAHPLRAIAKVIAVRLVFIIGAVLNIGAPPYLGSFCALPEAVVASAVTRTTAVKVLLTITSSFLERAGLPFAMLYR